MFESSLSIRPYRYDDLPTKTSFRVAELLPGKGTAPISCRLHTADWTEPPEYEAVSYTWGDPHVRVPVYCDGGRLEVTVNLYRALTHLRSETHSRFLWTDALCTNQLNIPERGDQVNQMKKIYESAKNVLIWLGEDTPERWAKAALASVQQFSDLICRQLGITISDLSSVDDVYQKVVFKNRHKLPLPDECDFTSDQTWQPLIWFYSQRYFTRAWVIQEINANERRTLHCGSEIIEWDRVHLVAGYFIMETAWSQKFGFSKTFCWWVATISGEFKSHAKDWLHMLYLASNFSCTDSRDLVYSLRGLMKTTRGADLLRPDYSKTVVEVYRNSVEAALQDFETTDVLLYTTSDESPSWVPRWNRAMLFRNPFRFGKVLPWRPSGDTRPIWKIQKDENVLSLTGFVVGSIEHVEPYNESLFGNTLADSIEGKRHLKQIWGKVLQTVSHSLSRAQLDENVLTAMAMSFSFGLDRNTDPGDPSHLLLNFVAYLKTFLDQETCEERIPSHLLEKARAADGRAFGKPVWDFEYPQSTFFITEHKLIGCSTSRNQPGDMVCIPLGSTYPLVLRPDKGRFLMRGFAYVHGIMYGECSNLKDQIFEIR